jgi:hypothetical protein
MQYTCIHHVVSSALYLTLKYCVDSPRPQHVAVYKQKAVVIHSTVNDEFVNITTSGEQMTTSVDVNTIEMK